MLAFSRQCHAVASTPDDDVIRQISLPPLFEHVHRMLSFGINIPWPPLLASKEKEKNVIQPKQLRRFLASDILRTMPSTRLTMSQLIVQNAGKIVVDMKRCTWYKYPFNYWRIWYDICTCSLLLYYCVLLVPICFQPPIFTVKQATTAACFISFYIENQLFSRLDLVSAPYHKHVICCCTVELLSWGCAP